MIADYLLRETTCVLLPYLNGLCIQVKDYFCKFFFAGWSTNIWYIQRACFTLTVNCFVKTEGLFLIFCLVLGGGKFLFQLYIKQQIFYLTHFQVYPHDKFSVAELIIAEEVGEKIVGENAVETNDRFTISYTPKAVLWDVCRSQLISPFVHL